MTRGVGGESPSNLALHLKGIDFPCRKRDLVSHVKKTNPDKKVMDALDDLPEREYKTMAEVMEGFGESHQA
jgi:poly-D-alanine transfer protein DltD